MQYSRGQVKKDRTGTIIIVLLALFIGMVLGLAIVQQAEVKCERTELTTPAVQCHYNN